jgi:hypothetical protein
MTTGELLRELHRLQLLVRDLRGEVERAPRRLKVAQAKIDNHQKQLQEHHEAIKHLKVSIHQKEVSIKDNQAAIEKYQSQMKVITSKKEYDALRHEIDNQRRACRLIEDEILEVMEQLEKQTAEVPVLEKGVQAAKEDYRKCEAEISGRQGQLGQQLDEAEAALKVAEEQLSEDLRKTYTRLVAAFGADALCPLQGSSCSGCYTDATPQQQSDARAGRIVTCKSCGRLLYV